jgi:UDP-N-acetylmuramate--L-alanine ligase/UDP-N-acetylenolpyruvoylglucosamine reductase
MIGIAGAGMSALAVVMADLGYRVTGSDRQWNPVFDKLLSIGAEAHVGHDAAHVGDADLVVASAAIPDNNPEVVAARAKDIPVISRAELLGQLMLENFGIGVAGTHGKTTTTSMLAVIFERAGLDTTVLVGGDIDTLKGNARLGTSDILLAEACEAFNSFLELSPSIAVVTNIDADHLDCYGSIEGVKESFVRYLARVKEGGCAIVCADCLNVQSIIPLIRGRVLKYGLVESSECRAYDVDVSTPEPVFKVAYAGRELGEFRLGVPGMHNVLNALAAIAVGMELEIAPDILRKGLMDFHGVARRFDIVGRVEERDIIVVDDYAHHPAEIRATLLAARSWGRRIVAIFQPHLFSRTQLLADDFAESLNLADAVYLMDIYPAREAPIPGVDSSMIVDRINRIPSTHEGEGQGEGEHNSNLHCLPRRNGDVRHKARLISDRTSLAAELASIAQPGDMLIFMGAGDIRPIAEATFQLLSAKSPAVSKYGGLPDIRGQILLNEPMSKHTSYGIGGAAEVFGSPVDPADLQILLCWARDKSMPVFVMGAGSNLLVSDSGIAGLVVRLGEGFGQVHFTGSRVIAGAAVPLSVLVKKALEHSLSGVEGLAGVPGTVGGAVCMNAGTPLSCIKDTLASVKVLDSELNLRQMSVCELGLRYRESDVTVKGWTILEAEFILRPAAADGIKQTVEFLLKKRMAAQPSGSRTAGSVFKNPEGHFAGQLLDTVGAKGLQIGGARVSEQHANFIENTGNASAADVFALMTELQGRVKSRLGIDLEPEITCVGFTTDSYQVAGSQS